MNIYSLQQDWKKSWFKKKSKNRIYLNRIFLFKSDFLKFKLDLLFVLIIFSNKKIIKFYYKIINVCNWSIARGIRFAKKIFSFSSILNIDLFNGMQM